MFICIITRNTFFLTTLARFIAIYKRIFFRIVLEPSETEIVLSIDFENKKYYNTDHFIREFLIQNKYKITRKLI